MSSIVLLVPDMCCPVEGNVVRAALLALPGVVDAKPDYAARRIVVSGEKLDSAALLSAVSAAGYAASLEAPLEGKPFRINVPDMDCPVEVAQIEAAFKRAKIVGARFDTHERIVTLPAQSDAQAAVAAIESCGYDATLLGQADAAAPAAPKGEGLKLGIALVIALVSEICDLVVEYRPGALGLSTTTLEYASFVLALCAILLSGIGTFKAGLKAIRNLRLNMNALMSVAVIGAVAIKAWPEAAMVMVLFQISESVEGLAMEKARRSIRELMTQAPETALVLAADGPVRRPASEVGAGAVVRVGPGERFPLDGVILRGNTGVDQAGVTGESLPVEKAPGDAVWAGTVNLSASVDVRVTAPASQSLCSRIIEAVENAQAGKSAVERFVDRFALVYTPIVFAVAAATAILPPLFLGNFGDWFYRALCLLVIACPCALVISTPVTIVSALATATRCGLLVKGGLYLEEARKLRYVGLDKTGTVTRGEPVVADFVTFEGAKPAQALACALALAAGNNHPLSVALAKFAKEKGAEAPDVQDLKMTPGLGVEGRVAGAALKLVNAHKLADETGDERLAQLVADAQALGRSATALADCFGTMALFTFEDDVKPEAQADLRELESVGLTCHLLTGDSPAAANALAQKVGLTHVKAGLLPQEKLEHIVALQKEGLTAMVGDGLNDAPALAQADIGVAMGVKGTDGAIEAAHVAVMDDRLASLATLVRLSRMTHAVLVQNIVFALGVKLVFTIMAISGHASMWAAVFADVGTCLIVVANGLRMLGAKPALERAAQSAALAPSRPRACD